MAALDRLRSGGGDPRVDGGQEPPSPALTSCEQFRFVLQPVHAQAPRGGREGSSPGR